MCIRDRHLIDVDKIHQAVERIVDSLDMAAGSTCHFDLYKVVETYLKDLDKRREINCLLPNPLWFVYGLHNTQLFIVNYFICHPLSFLLR